MSAPAASGGESKPKQTEYLQYSICESEELERILAQVQTGGLKSLSANERAVLDRDLVVLNPGPYDDASRKEVSKNKGRGTPSKRGSSKISEEVLEAILVYVSEETLHVSKRLELRQILARVREAGLESLSADERQTLDRVLSDLKRAPFSSPFFGFEPLHQFMSSHPEPPPVKPERPAGLDMRLPPGEWEKLRALGPVTEQNVKEHRRVFSKIWDSISDEHLAIDRSYAWMDLISPGRRAVFFPSFLIEVNNGGFDQFYWNSSGDDAFHMPEALELIGKPRTAALVRKANSLFPGGPSRFRVQRQAAMEGIDDKARELWKQCDTEFYDSSENPYAEYVYVYEHPEEFFKISGS
jgi:hypothetical protein